MLVFYALGLVVLNNKLLSPITAGSEMSGFCKTAQLMQLVMAVIHCDVC